MHKFVVFSMLLLLALGAAGEPSAWAQIPVTGYLAGWNMVGGPAGTDFSAAQILVGYRQGAYFAPGSSRATVCQGYFAYYAADISQSLPSSPNGNQTCLLQPGWNMIGNPFDGAAELPQGVIGFRWTPAKQEYAADTGIPVGGAVWIYSSGAGSVSLRFAAEGGLTLSVPPAATQPYTVHVGQLVTLLEPVSQSGVAAFVPRVNPVYLQAVVSGITAPPAMREQYNTWRAAKAGVTIIVVDPACLSHGCALPSFAIRLIILP